MATGSTVERGHSGRVLFLAIVAAIGGFLFGFDTAVINGAVDAIEQTFETSSFVTGFVVAVALLGSAVGAWVCRRRSRRVWTHPRDAAVRVAVRYLSDRIGIGVLAMGPRHLAFHWRCRDRGSVRHCPGLHRRGRPGCNAWTPRFVAAAGHRLRYLRGPAVGHAAGALLVVRTKLVPRAAGLALDVHGRGCSGGRAAFRRAHSGIAALPHPMRPATTREPCWAVRPP